jgi:hypothetical protein
MPPHMPPKYSYAVLALSAAIFGGMQLYLGGTDPFLLFVWSPFVVLSLAALVAKRNVVVRFAVVLGGLFLVINLVALASMIGTTSSTSAIGVGVLVILQLLVAAVVLLGGILAGRLPWGRRSDGIV